MGFHHVGHTLSLEVGQHGAYKGGDVCPALVGWVRKSHEGEGPGGTGSGQRLHPERLGACPAGSREPVNVHL